MKQYQNILFDLDGTLTDPGIGITNSVMYALKHYGIIETEREKLYTFIGPPLADSFKEFYNFSQSQAETAIKVYREYYVSKGIFELCLYDGITTLLHNLHNNGKQIILATSKPEEFAIKILEHYDLLQYFKFVAGSDMQETRVNKGDVIAYALQKAGITNTEKDTCIMIGDRKYDIIGAKENFIDSIGVLFGYGSRHELENEKATFIVETIQELSDLLFKM